MHKRLYVLTSIFLLSILVIATTSFSNDKIIDVAYTQLSKDAKRQVDCLADNIYYEAGHEPHQGKIAVAMVTLNRVNDPRYPKDICSVVKQKVNYTCQFTWFCENKSNSKHNVAYGQSKEVALLVYANYERMKDVTKGALFYHADYVNPKWALEKTTKIGRHIFYKERDRI
jgi:spore germination cell wall hydrolase CwlJ-like protein